MAQRGARQDYIAKIRYQNDLPPPPLIPKLLNYNNLTKTEKGDLSDPGLLSSLFRKENFKNLVELDDDFGMPIDLIELPGLIYGNENSLADRDDLDLHPLDRQLLRNPGAGKVVKSEPGVSFLRRTEYIAEERGPSSANLIKKKQLRDEKTDVKAQIEAIESTFDHAVSTLSGDGLAKLVHPRKKNLKAKKTWALLPDTLRMDQVFLGIKLIGSASIARISKEKDKPELHTSIFRPVTLEDTEWMSYYTTDTKSSINLKRKIDNVIKENEGDEPVALGDDEVFRFNHVRDFDMKFQRFEKAVDEMAIKFDNTVSEKPHGTAYYVPVGGRIDLKRRRVTMNESLSRVIENSNKDRINYVLREPTTEEIIDRDVARTNYDPMEYEGIGEEEEGEDEDEDEE